MSGVSFTMLLCIICYLYTQSVLGTITTEYEWTTIDFDWDNSIPMSESEAEDSGLYIMQNNIITGVKLYKDRIFVTVPRWRVGVPSTLNEVIKVNEKPILKPFPSWDMQQINNCSAIQYTQSVEIDVYDGKMWILDTGYKYFSDDADLYNNSNYMIPDTTCPPKIIIWDIDNNKEEHVYTFPDSVAKHNYTFLSDIVIDPLNKLAFIADQFGVPDLGAIVVYNYNDDTSSRFAHSNSMQSDPVNAPARTVTIDGISVTLNSGMAPIAITPDKGQGNRYIYYAPFSSYRTYRVPVQDVIDGVYDGIQFIGNRSSQIDHITFSDASNLYFAPLSENAIYKVHHQDVINNGDNWIQENEQLIVENDSVLEWTDMFAWPDVINNGKDDGYLYFTTCRLERFFLGTMDWSGDEGSNVKINKIKVGEYSYLYNAKSGREKDELGKESVFYVILGVVIGLVVIGIICFFIYKWKSRKGGDDANSLQQGLTADIQQTEQL